MTTKPTIQRLGIDDYRATGDGLIEWFAVGPAVYGITDRGTLLDADGCPLGDGGSSPFVRSVLAKVRAVVPLLALAVTLGCAAPTEPAPCPVTQQAPVVSAVGDTVLVEYGMCVTEWRMP